MLEAEQVINERYQLQKKLGRNAGRQTWLAKDLKTKNLQQVVVKLLAFGGDVQWEDLKLFEREAQTLQQLAHSRIPKYQDYFSIDDRTLWFGLVQEYIPGLSLKQLLDKGTRFNESQVKKIAEDILQILIYLHSFNPPLLHRDIKPSNLILGEDNNIYLVDFGAVQDSAATEGSTFTVVGTYGYAPMEQFGGKTVPASDLYALGATLVHLLTRTPPGELPSADLKLQFQDRINISSRFGKWLDKILYPAVEKRFKTAQEALDYLRDESYYLEEMITSSIPKTPKISHQKTLARPFGSNIKLERHPNLIEITIFPKDNAVLNTINKILGIETSSKALIFLFVALPCLFFVSPALFAWLFIFLPVAYIVITGKNIYGLKTKLTESKISINYNRFFITKKFLGFKNQQEGITENIQDISINYIPNTQAEDGLKPDSIIINTKLQHKLKPYERFIFGKGLNEDELLWLASEIRNWLASNSNQ